MYHQELIMSFGEIFTIQDENEPVRNCTVSREIYNHAGNVITYFSLDKDSDISPELYNNHKLLIISSGQVEILSRSLTEGECVITPVNSPVGVKALSDSVYTEILFNSGGFTMNEAIKSGEVFKLSELVPYQEGRIINMDIAHNDKMKFAVMAFAEGTGLSEHAAPGDALIFALDGEGIIGYEGREYHIKAGENFRFAKNGKHYVKAQGNFKMALLLTLD